MRNSSQLSVGICSSVGVNQVLGPVVSCSTWAEGAASQVR